MPSNQDAAIASKWTRKTLLLAIVVLVAFVGCLLWFGHDYGADLRNAAYYGDIQKVQHTLKAHPRVIDSYWPHPEALINNAQREGKAFSRSFELRLEWAKLRHLLRQAIYQQTRTQYDAWDENGFTALELAVESDHPDIVGVLLDHGADYAHLNAGNMTALHRAIRLGRLELVKQFLAHGCDLEITDRSGTTALCEAVLQQNSELAELLLAHGAKVDGGTNAAPLQIAALVNSKAMAELLITHGAQVNIMNRWRETPQAIAIRRGNTEIADFLRKHGAR
jgi:ankyrin repeat protein